MIRVCLCIFFFQRLPSAQNIFINILCALRETLWNFITWLRWHYLKVIWKCIQNLPKSAKYRFVNIRIHETAYVLQNSEFFNFTLCQEQEKKERKIKQSINNRICVWNVWKTYLRRLEVIFSNGIFPLHKLHLQTFITSLTTITLLTPNNSFLA